MSDAVAITGIVVSGILGPSVGGAFAYAHRRQATRQERERELVSVIDELMLDVLEAQRALEEVWDCAKDQIAYDSSGAIEAYARYYNNLPRFRYGVERVRIRLGLSGPVPDALIEVRATFIAFRTCLVPYTKGHALDAGELKDTAIAYGELRTATRKLQEAVHDRVGLREDSN